MVKRAYLITLIAVLFAVQALNTIAVASEFGTSIGSFNGVTSYSNGSTAYNSGIYNTSTGINTGLEWQCVEYVNRYYYQVYGMNIRIAGENANQYYGNALQRGLTSYANGGSVAPQVGDVICFDDGIYGHVAIVRTVGTSTITVIQQNVKNGATSINGTDDNWKFTYNSSSHTVSGNSLGAYNCQGWLRNTPGYSGGSGTAANPYKIATKEDLLALRYNTADYGKCFILMADIDLDMCFTTAIIAPYTNSISSGFQGTAFTGTFDGSGHKITHFTINGNGYLGLFGYIQSVGSVKNLGLENFTINGSDNSFCVGGLVGVSTGGGGNYGSISNCYSIGSVSGSSNVGGLVGLLWYNSISNCYSTSSVSGSSDVGGLVGYSNGVVIRCYSTSSVSGSSYVGGFAGHNFGNIFDCYSTSSVSGSSYVGGLVGENSIGFGSGLVDNSYSTGHVSGSSYVGGLVGNNTGYDFYLSNSFWDRQTSGQTTGVGGGLSTGVSGKTTSQMKTLSTFTGWDFATIWKMPNGDYPRLLWQALDPQGDEDGDGLLNGWETNGIDVNGDGVIDLDLPAMGADPRHKDVFVEVDYMVDSSTGGHSHAPKAEALKKVIDAFANAPVSNPDGTTGIRLHVDAGPSSIMNPTTNATWGVLSRSEALNHDDELGWRVLLYSWSEFDTIKNQHFSTTRKPAFHYCIFAHHLGGFGGTSGISRDMPAADFIVSLGSVGTVMQQAGTFMHELGHNLSLRHGGDNHENWKPNFLSVMNYSFQMGGLRINGLDGNMDYSIMKLPNLVEGTWNPFENPLNESVGLDADASMDSYGTIFFSGGQEIIVDKINDPTDWNNNGIKNESVRVDINKDGKKTTLTSYDDWGNLVFKGGGIGALGTEPNVPNETTVDELTLEEDAALIKQYAVSVGWQGAIGVAPDTTVICEFTVKNIGQFADTYHLNCTGLQGWADFNSIPTEISLDPNLTKTFAVSVKIPADANIGETEQVKLIAISQSNPNILDSALTTIFVVPNTAPISNAGPDQKAYAGVSLKANVTLNGSGSSDADGDQLTYKWKWTIGANTYTANVVNPMIQLPVGVYTFQLIVNDGIVDSAPDEVVVTVAVPAVSDLTVRSKETKVQLVWTHVGVPSYNVYRGLKAGGPYTLIANTTSTYSTYLDSNVTVGKTYYYVVREVLNGKELNQSNEVSATPTAPVRPRK